MDKASRDKENKNRKQNQLCKKWDRQANKDSFCSRSLLKHTNFCLFAPMLLPWDFSHSHGILEAEVSLPQDNVSMEIGESSGKYDYLRIDSYERQLHQKQGQSSIHLANTRIAKRFSDMMACICTVHVSDMKTDTISLWECSSGSAFKRSLAVETSTIYWFWEA